MRAGILRRTARAVMNEQIAPNRFGSIRSSSRERDRTRGAEANRRYLVEMRESARASGEDT